VLALDADQEIVRGNLRRAIAREVEPSYQASEHLQELSQAVLRLEDFSAIIRLRFAVLNEIGANGDDRLYGADAASLCAVSWAARTISLHVRPSASSSS
jgi:hypothetical protein